MCEICGICVCVVWSVPSVIMDNVWYIRVVCDVCGVCLCLCELILWHQLWSQAARIEDWLHNMGKLLNIFVPCVPYLYKEGHKSAFLQVRWVSLRKTLDQYPAHR